MQRVKDGLPRLAGLCYNPLPPVTRPPPGPQPVAGRASLMKNFLRALRVAWGYRGRLLLSLACALFAAAPWGLIFACIAPALYTLKNGNRPDNTPQNRHEAKIADAEKVIKDLEPHI